MLFLGIDLGTQGVRCIAVDEQGAVVAAHSTPFPSLNAAETEGLCEQRPADWETALADALGHCLSDLRAAGRSPGEIESLSIDGTSGTIVPLGADNRPLMNALMYNDPRAREEARRVHEAMRGHEEKMGLRFNASFSLPRILWIRDHLPEIYEKTRLFAHQADWAAGLLCGEYRTSDDSNALKTGYDLIDRRWPRQLASLGLDVDRLPDIGRPGTRIARISAAAADRFGLSTRTWVTRGSTDGYASALAAGAIRAGQWASIIGTTFVLKGVTKDLVIDPNGSSYSHRLPSGEWLLGGASNLGGRALNECAQGEDLTCLDRKSASLVPTGVTCYPLPGVGERFPFVDGQARAFYRGNLFGGRLYPALMEGVAFAERMALEHMASIGCPVEGPLYAAGGACRSDLWLRIRASVLGRQIRVPACVDAAMGSALLAASESFGSLAHAADAMIRVAKTADPDPALAQAYDDLYPLFLRDVKQLYQAGDIT